MNEGSGEDVTVDAWQQVHDIWERYSEKWEVRSDLVVEALGPDRSVRLRVGDWSYNKMQPDSRLHKPEPRITTRNVSTMRELAEALLAACDFVEDVNPTWAARKASFDVERLSQFGSDAR